MQSITTIGRMIHRIKVAAIARIAQLAQMAVASGRLVRDMAPRLSRLRGKKCEEKHAFVNEADAKARLKYLQARSRENKKLKNKLCIYCCQQCGKWHVGHDRRNWRSLAA